MNYQMLVNKNYKIGRGFKAKNLVDAAEFVSKKCNYKESDRPIMVEEQTLEAFKKLREDALKLGFKYYIDSAYRSYDFQKRLMENCIDEMGEKAYLYCAMPGTSEHQTGMALDLAYENKAGKYFWQVEDNSSEFNWLKNNAYKYGFILRYPKDKMKFTFVMFEPWHYRYVGQKLAKEIFDKKITLEEYYMNSK